MKYMEILKEEMQEVLKQIKPHFRENKVYILENKIFVEFGIYNYGLVTFNITGIDNTNASAIEYFDINDIFEEVGEDLKELKIKPVPKFDVNEWKKEFVKRQDLRIEDGDIYRKYSVVIDKNNNVNMSAWHDCLFELKHKLFRFDSSKTVYLKTKEECEEFERVYEIMDEYLRHIPGLNKEE